MRWRRGNAAVREAKPRQRMRCDHVDALGDLKAGRVGIDDEGRDAARARRFAGAGEDDVEIGDAAVRDPGLLAVEHVVVAVRAAPRTPCAATSEPASGSERANAAIASPARDLRQVATFCSAVPASAIAPRAEALHREREVGEAGVSRQRLAREADRARVDRVGGAAVLATGDGVREPASLAERTHMAAAGGVDGGAIVAVRVAEGAPRPGIELARERAMARLEERPVEVVGGRSHHHVGAIRSPGSTSYGSPHPGCVFRRSRHAARFGKRSSST